MDSIDNYLQNIIQITPDDLAAMSPAQKEELHGQVKQSLQFLKTVSEDDSQQEGASLKALKQGIKDLQKLDQILVKSLDRQANESSTEGNTDNGDKLSGLFQAMAMLVDIANELRKTADLGLAAGIELIDTIAKRQQDAVDKSARAERNSALASFGVSAALQLGSVGVSAKGLSKTHEATELKFKAAEIRTHKTTPDTTDNLDLDPPVYQGSKKQSDVEGEGEEGYVPTNRSNTLAASAEGTPTSRPRSDATADKSSEQLQALQETDSKSKQQSRSAKEIDRENRKAEKEALALERQASDIERSGDKWKISGDVVRGVSQSGGQALAAQLNYMYKTEGDKDRITADTDMKIIENFNQSMRSSAASAEKLGESAMSTMQSAAAAVHDARNRIM